jgi:hypothetical protein
MRTLFIIVALLGVLLMGLGGYEFRAVNEENIKITTFAETQYKSIYGHKEPAIYKLVWTSDNTSELEILSMTVASAGAVLAGIGFIGAIKSTKNVALPS